MAPVGRNSDTMVTVSIMCDLDECSFMLVAVDERFLSATAIRSNTDWILSTGTLVRPASNQHSRSIINYYHRQYHLHYFVIIIIILIINND